MVHEDEGLAYRMQADEIEGHLHQNKVKSRLVRSDLLQAQTLQQLELHEQQRQQTQQQQAMDEQLAKEMQLRLIEDEQWQAAEKQRIADEDEKLAQRLAEKERQKVVRRKQAREPAQIEKIKRDRLQFYVDNQLEITDSINDDLNDLDLSDFCMKPPGQLSGDQLSQFLADQDEELARFLQQYENQRKAALIKDSRTLLEHQDHEIARLLYEEEKAKARRLKEKRLQKQLLKQQQQGQQGRSSASFTPEALQMASGPSVYDPNNEQIYANLNQIGEQGRAESSLYEEPIHLHHYHPHHSHQHQQPQYHQDHRSDRFESPSSHYESYPAEKSESGDRFVVSAQVHHPQATSSTYYELEDDSHSTASSLQATLIGHNQSNNDRLNRDFEIFEPSEPVTNFVSRAQPIGGNFHNIAMDIDPTYNRRLKEQKRLSLNARESETSEQTEVKQLQEIAAHRDGRPEVVEEEQEKQEKAEQKVEEEEFVGDNRLELDLSGIHFAQLARVSPCVQHTEAPSHPPPPLPSSPLAQSIATGHVSPLADSSLPRQVAANVDEYIQFAMQQRQQGGGSSNGDGLIASGYHPLPVQGQRRHATGTVGGQKKSKNKDKNKDMCRHQ